MAKHFLISAAAGVLFFDRASQARSEQREGDFIVSSEEDLRTVPVPLMVAVYNDAAAKGQGKTITKFSDRTAAARRVWPTLDFLAKKGNVTSAADEKVPSNGKRGRTSKFAGMTIVQLTEVNPRREGTAGYNSWELITPGMKFEEYLAAGGRLKDLVWDINMGLRIRMEK